MKKVFIGAIIILVVLAIGAPIVSGIMMEKIVKNSYRDLNEIYASSGSGVTIEIVQYDRNFLSTEIEWKIKLGNLTSVYGMEEIVFVDRAKHGYTGVVSKTSLERNNWFNELVTEKLDGKNPLLISTKYKLTGQIHSTVSVDTFAYQFGENHLQVRPGEIVTVCDKGMKNISSDASWDGFSLSDKFSMDGLYFNTSLKIISAYILDGIASFGVQSINIEEEKGGFGLKNLKGNYSLDFDKEENTMSFAAEYGVDSITAGPQEIDNAFVRIGLNKLNAVGYKEFMELYVETMTDVIGDVVAVEDDPEKMKEIVEEQISVAGFQMVALGEKLLKKGLEIHISDLRVELPSGEITGDVKLGLNIDMTLAQFVPIMNQPELVFEIFSLKSAVTLPAVLVGDNPMLLSPAYQGMQTGLFVKKGEKLVHKAETRDGRLFVNGEEVILN